MPKRQGGAWAKRGSRRTRRLEIRSARVKVPMQRGEKGEGLEERKDEVVRERQFISIDGRIKVPELKRTAIPD